MAGETSNLELARLLWDELRYRHELFWKLFFRAVLAALALLSAPILYVQQLSSAISDKRIFIFLPFMAIVVALISTCILASELKLIRGVIASYRSIIVEYLKPMKLDHIYTVKTGGIATKAYWSFLAATVFTGVGQILLFFYSSPNSACTISKIAQ